MIDRTYEFVATVELRRAGVSDDAIARLLLERPGIARGLALEAGWIPPLPATERYESQVSRLQFVAPTRMRRATPLENALAGLRYIRDRYGHDHGLGLSPVEMHRRHEYAARAWREYVDETTAATATPYIDAELERIEKMHRVRDDRCVVCSGVLKGRDGNYVCPDCEWRLVGLPLGRAGEVVTWERMDEINRTPRPARTRL